MKAYMSLVVNRVMYSAETLMATYDTNADIDIFERSCLRTILKISWNDFTRNEDIYKKAADAMVAWTKLSLEFRRARLRYFGHVLRMDTERLPLKILTEALVDAKAGRGRPKSNWISTVKNDLKSRNLSMDLGQLSNLAASRDSWRRDVVYGTDRGDREEDGDLGEEEMNLLEALNTRLECGLQTETTSRALVDSLERLNNSLHDSNVCCKE